MTSTKASKEDGKMGKKESIQLALQILVETQQAWDRNDVLTYAKELRDYVKGDTSE